MIFNIFSYTRHFSNFFGGLPVGMLDPLDYVCVLIVEFQEFCGIRKTRRQRRKMLRQNKDRRTQWKLTKDTEMK
jgi:hypothetical protein